MIGEDVKAQKVATTRDHGRTVFYFGKETFE